MSISEVLVIVIGAVVGFLAVTFLLKVAKDARSLGKDKKD